MTVPSAVEVFVDEQRVFSRKVNPGPFEINDLPALRGDGRARIVVTDPSGRETVRDISLFNAPRLLAAGTLEYSFDVGRPRLSYGLKNFDYDPKIYGSGVVRYGLADRWTGEMSFQGGQDVLNGGIGTSFVVKDWAAINLSGSGSWATINGSRYMGAQATMNIATNEWKRLSLSASTSASFGDYHDIGSVVGIRDRFRLAAAAGRQDPYAIDAFSPPRLSTYIGLTYRIPEDWGGINVGYFTSRGVGGSERSLASATYSMRPWKDATFSISATHTFEAKTAYAGRIVNEKPSSSVYATLSFPIGWKDWYASTSASASSTSRAGSVAVTKSVGTEIGSWGARARASLVQEVGDERQKSSNRTELSAGASYRSLPGLTTLDVQQGPYGTRIYGGHIGSIAVSRYGVTAGQKIYDGVVVADVGSPGVGLESDGSAKSRSDWFGRGHVSAQGGRETRVRVRGEDLPLDALTDSTERTVALRRRTLSTVSYGAVARKDIASVRALLPSGEPMKLGTLGKAPDGADIAVGHDGIVVVTGLVEGRNEIRFTLEGKTCTMVVEHKPQPNRFADLGDNRCGPFQ